MYECDATRVFIVFAAVVGVDVCIPSVTDAFVWYLAATYTNRSLTEIVGITLFEGKHYCDSSLSRHGQRILPGNFNI